MKYLGAGGFLANHPNVDKGITAIAINVNLISYAENIKNSTIQTVHTFSGEHY